MLEVSMMSVQELNPEIRAPVVPQAWVSFLRAHASVTRALNAELVAAHGLTLNDYEVLLRLAHAPDRRLRRVDLAERVLLTASGITRLLEGLERSGFVRKARCTEDGRVVYAQLTQKGYDKLRASSDTHLGGIDRVFAGQFTDDERQTLAGLLGRLATEEIVDCTVD
jgi:DNA-binding MarR family transcriptional regulator